LQGSVSVSVSVCLRLLSLALLLYSFSFFHLSLCCVVWCGVCFSSSLLFFVVLSSSVT
jgi:hypothetical protein